MATLGFVKESLCLAQSAGNTTLENRLPPTNKGLKGFVKRFTMIVIASRSHFLAFLSARNKGLGLSQKRCEAFRNVISIRNLST